LCRLGDSLGAMPVTGMAYTSSACSNVALQENRSPMEYRMELKKAFRCVFGSRRV
jgi:hypothetical protein